MKIILKIQDNIYNLMRQCGYAFNQEENGELAFSRPLGASRSGYPRFHIYLKIDSVSPGSRNLTNNNLQSKSNFHYRVSREAVINLHLDQKKPVYMGVTAHSGEYDGELVEQEIERLKKILGP